MTPPTHPETEKLIEIAQAWFDSSEDQTEKAMIDTLVKSGRAQGAKEEAERWINQPANEHDEKIRKAERERIKQGINEAITGEEGRIMLVVKIMRIIESTKGET